MQNSQMEKKGCIMINPLTGSERDMIISQHAIVMVFGALLAIAGIVLLVIRNDQAQNKIKLLGQEFQISTPALVVFLAGCGVFILPLVMPSKNEPTFVIRLPGQTTVPALSQGTAVTTDEHEPNNEIGEANLISLNTTVKGAIAPDTDQDVFKIQTANPGLFKVRVILRKKTLGGFFAFLTVYNAVESKVAEKGESGEETISFAFDGAPSSSYYLIVSTYNHQYHGSYELLVKEEQ